MIQQPTSTLSEPGYENYAARAADLTESEVRALFAVAERPDVISFGGGNPAVSALSSEAIVGSTERVMRNLGSTALQYGSGQGRQVLREHICEVMSMEGINADPDNVVITTGSQQALELISKLYLDAGDVVLAESPSYVTALITFASYQADVEQIPMDEHGMIPDALRQRIRRVRAQGRTIKFLYVVPTFHNPMGVTLSESRRQEIVDIAQQNGILLVEDNPYGLLYFEKPAPPALRSRGDEGIVYLGTFSKTIAPGFRVGWVLAPPSIRAKLVLANESAVLSPSCFTQTIVSEYLESSDWKAQIGIFRDVYRLRKETMMTALSQHLPQLSKTDPAGGFFIWLTLPHGMNSKTMLPLAVSQGVAYTPGSGFYADDIGHQHMRLCYSSTTTEEIEQGVARLAQTIDDVQHEAEVPPVTPTLCGD